jgi:hypothetical protein
MESGILYQTLQLVGWLHLAMSQKRRISKTARRSRRNKLNFSVGELVVVMNHGDAWTHGAHIISLNLNESATMIKWESTGKIDYIEITDLKKNSEVET